MAGTQADAATLREAHLVGEYVVRVRKKNERRVGAKNAQRRLLMTAFCKRWPEFNSALDAVRATGREDGHLLVNSRGNPYGYADSEIVEEDGVKRVKKQDPLGTEWRRHVTSLWDRGDLPKGVGTLKSLRKYAINWMATTYGDNGMRGRLLGSKPLEDGGDRGLRERLLRGTPIGGTLRNYAVESFGPLTDALAAMRAVLIEAGVLNST